MRRAPEPGIGPELRARWREGLRLGVPLLTLRRLPLMALALSMRQAMPRSALQAMPRSALQAQAQKAAGQTGRHQRLAAHSGCAWPGLVCTLSGLMPLLAGASTGAAPGPVSGATGGALASALGLWLSVVSVAVALAWVSYRLGQSREHQRQQALQAQRAQVQTQAQAAQAERAERDEREAAAQAEQGQLAQQTALRQAQTDVLQAAALPLLLARAGARPAEGGAQRPLAAGDAQHPPAESAAGDSPSPGAWVLSQLNPAAAALWPTLQPGQPLGEVLQQLRGPCPEGLARPPVGAAASGALEAASVGDLLAAALPSLEPGDSAQAGGWRLLRPAAPAPGQDSLLLAASGPGWASSAGQAAPAPSAASPLAPAPSPPASPGPPSNDHAAAESDHFSFTLSHDLRAPIRVVEGFTRIVKEDYGRLLDRVGNDHLDRVLGAAARMNLMIDALLTLARLSSQPLARQPVNLTQLAHYVIDDLKRQQPERAAQVDIEPGLTAVGDPTLLRLVLENLLGNAWKYSGRSASTCIAFKRETVDERPAFVVRDQGAGFDMRSADRLFGLFQRLHSANDFPGTGVGLASVRRIVRRHGGEIWAEAEPGRGASFHFTLAN